jgi:hypothetical protein
VAARLLRAWKIPERMVSAVAGHHWLAKLREENRALAASIYAGGDGVSSQPGNGFPALPDKTALALIRVEVEDLAGFLRGDCRNAEPGAGGGRESMTNEALDALKKRAILAPYLPSEPAEVWLAFAQSPF